MNYQEQNFAVKIFKLLSNANRLRIIDLLRSGSQELTATMIAEKLDLEITNVSNHLVRLRENNILAARQDGVSMFYKIKNTKVMQLIDLAKKLS